MAVRIDERLCRGCGKCAEVCPGDLLTMVSGRARPRSDRSCWFCLSCAKACHERAISGRLPFVLGDAGASLWPETSGDTLKWVCEHPEGEREEF